MPYPYEIINHEYNREAIYLYIKISACHIDWSNIKSRDICDNSGILLWHPIWLPSPRVLLISHWNWKKSMKISAGLSEAINRRTTDNIMTKRKRTKYQTTIWKNITHKTKDDTSLNRFKKKTFPFQLVLFFTMSNDEDRK